MNRFLAGVLITAAGLAIPVGVWFSLDTQARGVVVGVAIGGAGACLGAISALAIVGLVLLRSLQWSVAPGGRQGAPPPPPVVIVGREALGLPAPQDQGEFSNTPPSNWRKVREWEVLGQAGDGLDGLL